MKVAIATEGSSVAEHFGRCSLYTIVDIEEGKKPIRKVVENPGHAPGAIPKFLNEMNAECIVAGGMGVRAQQLFDQYNIAYLLGVTGSVDEVINSLQENTLTGGISLCSRGGGHGDGSGHEHAHEHKHENHGKGCC